MVSVHTPIIHFMKKPILEKKLSSFGKKVFRVLEQAQAASSLEQVITIYNGLISSIGSPTQPPPPNLPFTEKCVNKHNITLLEPVKLDSPSGCLDVSQVLTIAFFSSAR